jgi:hypothetical protein
MKKLYFLFVCIVYLSVAHGQRVPKAVNDLAAVGENGTIAINVLANDSNFNMPDSVCLTGLWGGASGWATVHGCTQVLFHPLNPTFSGLDTFYYGACDQVHPALCDTGRVIVTIYFLSPKAISDTVTLIEGDSITLNVLANDSNFNPQDSLRISGIWGAPTGWATVKDSTQVTVRSINPNYYGLLGIYYRSFDRTIPTLVDTGTIVINVIRTPKAYIDTSSLIQPDTSFIYVIANDSDFNAFDSACVTNVWGAPAGWATVQGCNEVVYHPIDFNHLGTDTFYYRSCYTQTPTLCDTSRIIVQVILPLPQVDFFWNEDSPCVAQVFNNSTLSDSVVWYTQIYAYNIYDTLYNAQQFYLATYLDSGFQAQVCLRSFNPSGDTTVCYTFYIQCSISTGLSQPSSAKLTLYPNPASDKIQIDLSKTDQSMLSISSSVVVYDMIGKELKSIPISEINNAISVSDLSAGMYIIGLVDKDQNRKMLTRFEVIR